MGVDPGLQHRGGVLVDHFQVELDLQKEAVSFWGSCPSPFRLFSVLLVPSPIRMMLHAERNVSERGTKSKLKEHERQRHKKGGGVCKLLALTECYQTLNKRVLHAC